MGTDTPKMVTAFLLLSLFLFYSGNLYLSTPSSQQSLADVPGAHKGKQLWQQKNCVACHQVFGLGGYLGPDLTNVYSIKGPAYIKAFLASGTSVMPNFGFSEAEMEDIVAYMKMLDASGNSDPRTFLISVDGTITQ